MLLLLLLLLLPVQGGVGGDSFFLFAVFQKHPPGTIVRASVAKDFQVEGTNRGEIHFFFSLGLDKLVPLPAQLALLLGGLELGF